MLSRIKGFVKEFIKKIDILDLAIVALIALFVSGAIPVILQKDVKEIIEIALAGGLVFKKLPPSFGPVLGSIIEKLLVQSTTNSQVSLQPEFKPIGNVQTATTPQVSPADPGQPVNPNAPPQ